VKKLAGERKTPVRAQLILPEIEETENAEETGTEEHEDQCSVCGEPGRMLCCDGEGCTVVSHLVCAGLDVEPAGDCFCAKCLPLSTPLRKSPVRQEEKKRKASTEPEEPPSKKTIGDEEDSGAMLMTQLTAYLQAAAKKVVTDERASQPAFDLTAMLPAFFSSMGNNHITSQKIAAENSLKIVQALASQNHYQPHEKAVVPAPAPAHGLTTSEFLKERGFGEYAIHFEEEGYNGEALLSTEKDDVERMPIKSLMKQKAFLRMVERLNREYPQA
jgi:hypothetical protein